MADSNQRLSVSALGVATWSALALAASVLGVGVNAQSAEAILRSRTLTEMYERGKQIGVVIPEGRYLTVSCDLYENGNVETNARETWIFVNSQSEHHWGFARLQRPGRWMIYRTEPTFRRQLVGFAKQRTNNRWDVYDRRSRRVGYTLGSEGPQAAAALLTMCRP
jgi:hypothetical protein